MNNVKFYMAPLEGLTVFTYRNAYAEMFGGISKYFTPFMSAEGSYKLKDREKSELALENNKSINLVPQILSNNSDNFIRFAGLIQKCGYNEVNLNLGCPSGTVTAKGKGSGFLAKTVELDRFLDRIYSGLPDMKISIKTRIGRDDPDEIYELMKIYNKYPIHELIVHPRTKKDYYRNEPRMDAFKYAYEVSSNPICYNGDINTVEDYRKLINAFPKLDKVMIGRGVLRDPSLIRAIIADRDGTEYKLDRKTLRQFHDNLYQGYKTYFHGEKVLLFKMKEMWCYLLNSFEENPKYTKMLKKSTELADYELFVEKIFSDLRIL